MVRELIIAVGLGLALTSFGVNAAGSGYYRWTDENGQTHFSQKPPEGKASDFVRSSTGSTEKPAQSADDDPSKPQKKAEATPEQAKQPETLEALPEKDPERCARARNMQKSLEGYSRIRAKQADGTYRVLTEEDKTQQRETAQKAIEIYCD